MKTLTKTDIKDVLIEVGVVTKSNIGTVLKGYGAVTGQDLTTTLKAFATKKDLDAFATKKDLLSVKKALLTAISNIAVNSPTIGMFDKLEKRVSNLEASVN